MENSHLNILPDSPNLHLPPKARRTSRLTVANKPIINQKVLKQILKTSFQ